MTASGLFPFFEASVESSASGPVQKTESEKSCAFPVCMLPIGSSSNGCFSTHHLPNIRLNFFFFTQNNRFSVMLSFKKTSSQDVSVYCVIEKECF